MVRSHTHTHTRSQWAHCRWLCGVVGFCVLCLSLGVKCQRPATTSTASVYPRLSLVQNVGQRPDLALQLRLLFVQFVADFRLHREQIGQMVGVRHVQECGEQLQPVVFLQISVDGGAEVEYVGYCRYLLSVSN